jgi:hypothetical protein
MMGEGRKRRFFEKKRAENFCAWASQLRCPFIAPDRGDKGTPQLRRQRAKVFLVTPGGAPFFAKKVTSYG